MAVLSSRSRAKPWTNEVGEDCIYWRLVNYVFPFYPSQLQHTLSSVTIVFITRSLNSFKVTHLPRGIGTWTPSPSNWRISREWLSSRALSLVRQLVSKCPPCPLRRLARGLSKTDAIILLDVLNPSSNSVIWYFETSISPAELSRVFLEVFQVIIGFYYIEDLTWVVSWYQQFLMSSIKCDLASLCRAIWHFLDEFKYCWSQETMNVRLFFSHNHENAYFKEMKHE